MPHPHDLEYYLTLVERASCKPAHFAVTRIRPRCPRLAAPFHPLRTARTKSPTSPPSRSVPAERTVPGLCAPTTAAKASNVTIPTTPIVIVFIGPLCGEGTRLRFGGIDLSDGGLKLSGEGLDTRDKWQEKSQLWMQMRVIPMVFQLKPPHTLIDTCDLSPTVIKRHRPKGCHRP